MCCYICVVWDANQCALLKRGPYFLKRSIASPYVPLIEPFSNNNNAPASLEAIRVQVVNKGRSFGISTESGRNHHHSFGWHSFHSLKHALLKRDRYLPKSVFSLEQIAWYLPVNLGDWPCNSEQYLCSLCAGIPFVDCSAGTISSSKFHKLCLGTKLSSRGQLCGRPLCVRDAPLTPCSHQGAMAPLQGRDCQL